MDVTTKNGKIKDYHFSILVSMKHNYTFYVFQKQGSCLSEHLLLAILLSPSVKRKASIYLNSLCQCQPEGMLHEITISIKLIITIIVTIH